MDQTNHPWDRVLVPSKAFVYHRLLGGDERRYLAVRNVAARAGSRLGLYERESLAALEAHVGPGDVAIDVGASFGVYTASLARRVGLGGQVHSFEPQHQVFELLQRRFRRLDQVTMVNAALADHSGTAKFVVPTVGAGAGVPETALGGLSRGSDGATLPGSTRVTTLDEYCAHLDRLAFVKVDAEGWDVDVLRGGSATLQRLRPVVQVEVNDDAVLADLRSFVGDVGYRLDDRVLSGVNRILHPA